MVFSLHNSLSMLMKEDRPMRIERRVMQEEANKKVGKLKCFLF